MAFSEPETNPMGTLSFTRMGAAFLMANDATCTMCGSDQADVEVTPSERTPDSFSHAKETWCTLCADAALEGEIVHLDRGAANGKTIKLVPINFNTWSLVARHGAGNSNVMPGVGICNRQIIWRLKPASGEPFLVMLNANVVDKANNQPIQAIKNLEKNAKAKLKYCLTPGDSHHMSFAAYTDVFPECTFLFPNGRVPRAAALEKADMFLSKNVKVYDPYAEGTELPDLASAGLHVHTLIGLKDSKPAMGSMKGYPRNTSEQCMFYHEESNMLVNGTHLFWFWPAEEKRPMGFMFRRAFNGLQKGGHYNVLAQQPVNPDKHGVYDLELLRGRVDQILAHQFHGLVDCHTGPNTVVTFGDGAREFVEGLFENVRDDEKAKLFCPTVELQPWTGFKVGAAGKGKPVVGMHSAAQDSLADPSEDKPEVGNKGGLFSCQTGSAVAEPGARNGPGDDAAEEGKGEQKEADDAGKGEQKEAKGNNDDKTEEAKDEKK